MSFQVKYIYDLVDKISPKLKKINAALSANAKKISLAADKMAASFSRVEKKLSKFASVDKISPKLKKINANLSASAKKAKAAANKMATSFSKLKNKLSEVGVKAKQLGKDLFLKTTVPISLMTGYFLKSAASMETMKTSFVGILGSAEKAGDMVNTLNEFTARTPFQIDQVAGSAKKLLASKEFTASDIPKALQMIGDLAAAADTNLEGLAAVFSKAAAKGKVQGEIFEMFNDRGIPVLATMAEQMNVTKSEILDMGSKGQITFIDLLKATKKMTSGGGFAFQAMALQSKTAAGIFSTLKDNITLAAAEIGNVLLPDFKKLSLFLIDVAQNVKEFVKQNPELTKTILIFAGIVAVAAPLLIVIGLMASGIAALSGVFAVLVGPVGIVIGALTIITIKFKKFREDLVTVVTFISNVVISAFKSLSGAIDSVGNFLGLGGDNNISADLNKTTNINQRQSVAVGGQLDIMLGNVPKGSKTSFTPLPNNQMNVGVNPIYAGG